VLVASWNAGKLGVSNEQLQKHFRVKKRHEWTIADINYYVIIPQIKKKNIRFYTEMLESDEVGTPFQGCYLIAPRACVFSNVVASLSEYCALQSESPSSMFVFLDLFGMNQSLLTSTDPDTLELTLDTRGELISFQLQEALGRFDKTIAFVDSLINPNILKRTWSAWELFSAAQSCKSIDIVTAPGKDKEFLNALMDNPFTISSNLSEFKIRNTHSFNELHKQMIIEAMEITVTGSDVTVNSAIKRQVRNLFVQATKSAVARFDCKLDAREKKHQEIVYKKYGRCYGCIKLAASKSIKLGSNDFQIFLEQMLANTTKLLQAHSAFDKSLELYLHVHSMFFKLYTFEEDDETFSHVRTLNNIILEQTRSATSIFKPKPATGAPKKKVSIKTFENSLDLYRVYRQSLQVYAAAFGEKHAEVGRMFNNLGRMAFEGNDFENSIYLFSQAIPILKERYKLTKENQDLIYALHMLAMCYSYEEMPQECWTLFEELTTMSNSMYADTVSSIVADLGNVAKQYPDHPGFTRLLCDLVSKLD